MDIVFDSVMVSICGSRLSFSKGDWNENRLEMVNESDWRSGGKTKWDIVTGIVNI